MSSWHGVMECVFQRNTAGKTCLTQLSHTGPLRVQRLFYDHDLAHCYLLHPPGGLVSGDRLAFSLQAQADTRVLITTPSSGKVYRARTTNQLQEQTVSIRVGEGAFLAHVPQATIAFNGCMASLVNTVNIANSGCYIGWEQLVFGRHYGDAPFVEGMVKQQLSIYRDNTLLYHENMLFTPDMLQTSAVLDGWRSFATMVIVLPNTSPPLNQDQVHVRINALMTGFSGLCGVSFVRDCLLLVRLVSNAVDEVRRMLERMWCLLATMCMGRIVTCPRIWST